jgi:peptidyl-prolyl cis-trans isomerase SurA
MKKGLLTVLVLVVAVLCATPVFSDSISTPIVRINLIRNAVITQQQLDEAVSTYSEAYGTTFDEATVLDALISDELFKQGLEKNGYTLTDEQKDQLLASQKSSIESQLGYSLTDEEFDALLQSQQGLTTEEYKEYIANQYLLQSYVYTAKASMFKNVKEPTTSEIESFYKKNKSSFISQENVKLSHIYFEFGDDKEAALAKATEVSNKIKSGEITFEQAVTEYSDDTSSKDSAGEIGWLQINDTSTMSYMGENFFDKVFELKAGEVSDVIESLAGYHIVKVSVHNDTKILGLDDKIYPTETTTVRDYIYSYLYSQNVNTTFQEAYLSLIADLKAEASIKYLK